MKKFIFPLLFLIIVVSILCINIFSPSLKGDIYAKDFGIFIDDEKKADENSKILNKIIKKADKESKIILPQGKIYISDYISVCEKSQLIIEGNNTKIINTKFSPYNCDNISNYSHSNILNITKSDGITISKICIDYLNYVNVSGEIVDFKEGYTIFKVFDNSKLNGGENVFSATVFDKNENRVGEKYFDTPIRIISENISKNLFKISGFYGQDGQNICIRFSLGEYSSPAIYLSETRNISFENINILSCPSSTLYAPYENENIYLDNFNIASDNKKRIFSSNEDGIHIKALRGNLIIKNSNFTGLGDDILNVHSKAAKIVDTSKNKVIATIGNDDTKADNLWAKKGDIIDFYNESLEKISSETVVDIKNGQITFENLNNSVSGAYIMQNSAHCPKVIIDNINIERCRARGLLLQTKDIKITNSKFKNLFLPAILISPDISKWFEMGPSENVLIQNNYFTNCAISNSFGVITVCDRHDSAVSNISSKIHKSINISENTFENTSSPAVVAIRTEKTSITNNKFINAVDTIVFEN